MLDRRQFLEASALLLASFSLRAQTDKPFVVDAHCHAFNAKDLPVEGFITCFLRGFQAFEIPDLVVTLLKPAIALFAAGVEGGVLTAKEELNQLPANESMPIALLAPTPTTTPSGKALLHSAAEEARRLLGPLRTTSAELKSLVNDVDDDTWVVARLLDREYADPQVQSFLRQQYRRVPVAGVVTRGLPTKETRDPRYWRFLALSVDDVFSFVANLLASLDEFWKAMKRRRADNLQQMAGLSSSVVLFTPALCDFDIWADKKSAASPVADQVKLMGSLSRRAAQGALGPAFHVHGLVGFNPQKAGALDDVKAAVLQHGFIGVKLYLNCGFAPRGNAATLQQRLEELYAWCAANDVPILVHTGLFNSFSKDVLAAAPSRPDKWDAVLQDHDKLRVLLAHAGLHESDWLDRAAGLARKYDRVYLDISDNDKLPDADFQRVHDVLRKNNDELAPRLLYGTDWFMCELNQTPSTDYLKRVHDQMCTDQFPAGFCDSFFASAARRFFGLDKKTREPHKRLVAFYGGNTPSWLS